ncbi:unnamed protein product [Diamesa serratosioi]
MKKSLVILLLCLLKCLGYSLADEAEVLLGEELIGDNVCKRVEEYNVTVVVSESVPYQERVNSWCWEVPPRCAKYKLSVREEKRVEVLTKSRGIKECCQGYTKLGARCVPYCENKCQHGTCIATGVCKCDLKYGGPACDFSCPQGQWGKQCILKCNCENKGYCDPYNGQCRCRKGYTGFKCDKLCPADRFGLDCSEICDCKNGATCDSITGKCQCADGFAGLTCEDQCKDGNNIDQCTPLVQCENEGSWDRFTGKCVCTPGWTGFLCNETCSSNFYGDGCSKECSCLNNAKCDHINGDCHCALGFMGTECSEKCTENTHGQDCELTCNCMNGGDCSHIDGVCQCLPGWLGETCDEPCPASLWGPKCSQKCKCQNKSQCRKNDGICICNPGFMGQRCDEICPEGFYGKDCVETCNCDQKLNSVCHPAHGCVCRIGFTGKNCEVPSQDRIIGYQSNDASKAGVIWGLMLSLIATCLIILLVVYYRRRVANLKAEFNHVVKYMTEDPSITRQNDSCQLSIQSDYSTLLHANKPMNNFQTNESKPSNVHQLNNFNRDDSNLSDQASYNPDYLNQKNFEADSTNPDLYHSIEDISQDHLYDEIKKAKEEMREDESRKSQSLAHFRELISKHPGIKKCRTDDIFLLKFLRTKKYSIDDALMVLENHLMFLHKHQTYFLPNIARNERLNELYEKKILFPLSQKDDKGRKGLLLQLKNIDSQTINFTDLYTLGFELGFCMMEDEETQIAGIILVVDFSGAQSLDLYRRFSILECKEMSGSFNNSMPGRIKGLYMINPPPTFLIVIEILKLVASKKLADRVILVKNHDELKEHFDIKIMPKELGGEIPEVEMIEEFRKIQNKNEEALRLTYNFEIDSNEMSELEKPGSFRTLNID